MKTQNEMKGQVLLFVVVAMTLSLALGIGIANRTVNTVTETARTDTYSRLKASADATVEKLLTEDVVTLNTMESNWDQADPASYSGLQTYEDPENILPDIDVYVYVEQTNSNFPTNISPTLANTLRYKIEKGSTIQYDISTYAGRSASVCWVSEVRTQNSALHFTFYRNTPPQVLSRFGYMTSIISGLTSFVQPTFISIPSGHFFSHCANVVVPATADILRVSSVLNNVTFGISTTTTDNNRTLPDQAYKITAKAEFTGSGEVKERHEVIVYRSAPFVALPLDFAVYSEDTGWTF